MHLYLQSSVGQLAKDENKAVLAELQLWIASMMAFLNKLQARQYAAALAHHWTTPMPFHKKT